MVKDIAGGEIEGAQVSGGLAYATSDEDGRFELWVAEGTTRVAAECEGYARGTTRAHAPIESVELFLTPESVLVGRVVDTESGAGVEGLTVRVNREASTLSGADGQFRLAGLQPGTYKPEATGDRAYGQTAEQVHLGLGETSEPVEIRVHPMTLIEGTIVFAGAKPRPCEDGQAALVAEDDQRHAAQTEAGDGHVAIRAVPPGEYRVEIWCRGAVAEDQYPDLVVVAGRDQRALEWEVREGLTIRGVVVDDRGVGVEGQPVYAVMQASDVDVRTQRTSSGFHSLDDGSFVLDGLLPGTYKLNLNSWGGGGRPALLEAVEVELEAGADVNDVRLELTATGELVGRVVDARGEPVAGASLTAQHLEHSTRGETRSGDDGQFRFEHLRPGEVRVTASEGPRWGGSELRKPGTHDDDIQGELVEIVANGQTQVELVVESRGGVIRGQVLDEDGGPVADAFVDIERMSDAAGSRESSARSKVRWSWDSQPVLTDPDGRFVIDDLPEGQFMVRAYRKGGGEALAEGVALGQEVELIIARTGEIAGAVTVEGGEAPERFQVIVRDRESGFARRDEFFRTAGAWRLREIPAGHYSVTATAGGGLAEAETDLGEGEVREGVDLVLAPLLTVKGRLVDLETGDPVAGLQVMAMNGSAGVRINNTDSERNNISGADGRFVVERVPSGAVHLFGWNRNFGGDSKYEGFWARTTLDPTPTVQDLGDFEVVPRRLAPGQRAGDLGMTLEEIDYQDDPALDRKVVAFVRPGGPAEVAGAVAGDVIASVDGHDVQGVHASRWEGLSKVPPGTTLALTLTDGRALTLLVGPPI